MNDYDKLLLRFLIDKSLSWNWSIISCLIHLIPRISCVMYRPTECVYVNTQLRQRHPTIITCPSTTVLCIQSNWITIRNKEWDEVLFEMGLGNKMWKTQWNQMLSLNNCQTKKKGLALVISTTVRLRTLLHLLLKATYRESLRDVEGTPFWYWYN